MRPVVAISPTPRIAVRLTPPDLGQIAPWLWAVPLTEAFGYEYDAPARAPMVERVAGWSARHRKTAVVGWLLLAGTAVMSAISLLAIPSRWLPIDSTTSSIVLLVGMAVGIDYSLFYLRRTREERAAGRSTTEALRIAAHTSGRAILVSGLTVMIALAGLFLTGIDVFSGVAIGTILVVGVAVLGSLTFLPAMLSLLGPWTWRAAGPTPRPTPR